MNILIVGGTGLVGGAAALHLSTLGHAVSIAGRQSAAPHSPLAKLPFLQGDYVQGTFTVQMLKPFDTIVFAAGNDSRHLPKGDDTDSRFVSANEIAIPQFASTARDAGCSNFVYIGTLYAHVAPDLVETDAYVRSRKVAAEKVMALSGPGFHACVLDVPFVVGRLPGLESNLKFFADYAAGRLDIPPFAPHGGTNFISLRSVSEAIASAVENGNAVSGEAFLLGDENLTFASFFELFFKAAGKDVKLDLGEKGKGHPLLPPGSLPTGERTIAYTVSERTTEVLHYHRGDIEAAVKQVSGF